jgi:hypothetical protein
LNSAQIAWPMTAVSVVSILSQPFWGALGDRSASRNRVLRTMCALAAGLILLLPLSDGLWYLSAILGLFAANYTAIQPMGDSVILESLQQRRQPFGPMRLLGTYPSRRRPSSRGADRRPPGAHAVADRAGAGPGAAVHLPPAPNPGHAREKSGARMAELLKDKKLMR